MSLLSQHPRLADALESLALLAGFYLAARFVSYLFGKLGKIFIAVTAAIVVLQRLLPPSTSRGIGRLSSWSSASGTSP